MTLSLPIHEHGIPLLTSSFFSSRQQWGAPFRERSYTSFVKITAEYFILPMLLWMGWFSRFHFQIAHCSYIKHKLFFLILCYATLAHLCHYFWQFFWKFRHFLYTGWMPLICGGCDGADSSLHILRSSPSRRGCSCLGPGVGESV